MAFARLTYRESLRDIEACLRSVTGKLYHRGFRHNVQKLDLLQIVQVAEPVATVLAAILALCVGPSIRFDCC